MSNIRAAFILGLLAITITTFVSADEMRSPSFRLELGNLNSASDTKSSGSYTVTDTLGQTAAQKFESTGFIVKAGFQYYYSIIPFRFSISTLRVNLGTLQAASPSTATTVLTVSSGGAGGYQVTAIENTPLQTLTASNNIPDTQCDSGPCTETTAQPWTSSSTYGFGYNMNGNDVPATFVNNTYYRPFPDRSAAESPAVVMSSVNVGRNRQATVTFKANVSNVQAAGSYQTVVNFVATPKY